MNVIFSVSNPQGEALKGATNEASLKRISTVDLLVLRSSEQLLFILKLYIPF